MHLCTSANVNQKTEKVQHAICFCSVWIHGSTSHWSHTCCKRFTLLWAQDPSEWCWLHREHRSIANRLKFMLCFWHIEFGSAKSSMCQRRSTSHVSRVLTYSSKVFDHRGCGTPGGTDTCDGCVDCCQRCWLSIFTSIGIAYLGKSWIFRINSFDGPQGWDEDVGCPTESPSCRRTRIRDLLRYAKCWNLWFMLVSSHAPSGSLRVPSASDHVQLAFLHSFHSRGDGRAWLTSTHPVTQLFRDGDPSSLLWSSMHPSSRVMSDNVTAWKTSRQ